MHSRIPLLWTVGHSESPDDFPEEMVPAAVPGAVQLDWAKAKDWPEYWKGDNFREYSWMEDKHWRYRTTFDHPEMAKGDWLYLVCGGVDYEFEIRLNGHTLLEQAGMHTPVNLDLTPALQTKNELEIIVYPIPKLHNDAVNHTQADRSCKPPVSYGWDWHPRLVPMGIWKDTFLEVRKSCYLRECELSYELDAELQSAELKYMIELSEPPGENCTVVSRLIDASGKVVAEENWTPELAEIHASATLKDINLWWPHDHGEPYLYLWEVELRCEDERARDRFFRKVGFRQVKLVMYEGAWEEEKIYPKGRWDPPITLEVNGRHIFVKGTNWVNPEIFPGIIDAETYRPLIEKAKEANFNILRTWGGAIVNKDSFFEICDEMGMLLWQEFTQACLPYEGTHEYLKVLEQESRSIIKQVRPHPCLAIWSGGNELFATWSRMTDQSLALRLLNKNCYELDPLTPFIPTAPLMGMAHGDYRFRDHEGREVYQIFGNSRCTAYSEFGVPSPSSVETLKSFLTEEELFPPKRGTAWESHHAYNVWHGDTNAWLMPWVIEYYFGKSETLEQLVERGQWLQSEGYKGIYEEARRQKPRCSMALNWCYNEPWPCAANNSLISWPLDVKPALAAVGESCRPQLCSLRFPKFLWHSNDFFEATAWILNDKYAAIPAGKVTTYLMLGDERVELGEWSHDEVAENRNLEGPLYKIRLPERDVDVLELHVESSGSPALNSTYRLRYIP